MATNNGTHEAFTTTNDERPNVLDTLTAIGARKLRVERLQAFGLEPGEKAKDFTGFCGTVPNREGVEIDIGRQWGGGLYQVSGKDSNGRTVSAEIQLPGDSRPLVEDEDEEDDAPPPRRYPGYNGPGPYGPGPYPGPFPGPMGPPPGPRPAWADYYHPESAREVAALKEKVRDLEMKLHQKELEAAHLQRDLDAAKETAREAKLRAEFNDKLAQIQAAQAKPDPAGGTTAMILEFMKLQSQERAARASKDSEAIAENARQQQTFFQTLLQNQQNTFQAAMQAKSGKDDLLSTLKGLKELTGNPLEQFKAFAEVADYLKGGNSDEEDGDDEGEGSLVEELVKAAPRILRGVATSPAPEQQQIQQHPQPQPIPLPQNGAPVAVAKKQEAELSSAAWAQILAEVLGYYTNNLTPEQAAAHMAQFCRTNGVPQAIPALASETPASIAAKVKPVLGQLPAMLPITGVLTKVVEVLESERGAAWATALIAKLKA
jgi:hypothetical protein